MRVRLFVYNQADYLSRKYFHVHIHELPDGKRREVLKKAAEQIAQDYTGAPTSDYDIQTVNLRRPNTAFDPFVQAILLQIARCLNKIRIVSMSEICICAAVKTKGGYPVCGHRHADCFGTIKDMGEAPDVHAQGFITSEGRFVTREEGYKLHVKAGIPSKAKGGYRGERLFSEDLY